MRTAGRPDGHVYLAAARRRANKCVSKSNQRLMRRARGQGVPQRLSPWHKGLRAHGTAVAISTSQGCVAARSEGRGSQSEKRPAANTDFVDAAGESQCVLRGCGGATEKQMSLKNGTNGRYNVPVIVTGRRKGRPRHFFRLFWRMGRGEKQHVPRSRSLRATDTHNSKRTAKEQRRGSARSRTNRAR